MHDKNDYPVSDRISTIEGSPDVPGDQGLGRKDKRSLGSYSRYRGIKEILQPKEFLILNYPEFSLGLKIKTVIKRVSKTIRKLGYANHFRLQDQVL